MVIVGSGQYKKTAPIAYIGAVRDAKPIEPSLGPISANRVDVN
jgi:hypothetical protein